MLACSQACIDSFQMLMLIWYIIMLLLNNIEHKVQLRLMGVSFAGNWSQIKVFIKLTL